VVPVGPCPPTNPQRFGELVGFNPGTTWICVRT
jgi:hypothetical protein